MSKFPDLSEFESLPKFMDGRIDYTDASKAPVLNCVVFHNGKVLILKRSDKVVNYKGKWNVVAGFLDERKPVEQFALEELSEELGITPSELHVGRTYEVFDESAGKTWIVYPVLAVVESPEVTLDWEHSDFKWIEPSQVEDFDRVYLVEKSINSLLNEFQPQS